MKKNSAKKLSAKTEEQLLEEKAPLLEELTQRQSQILSFIVAHITAHGCAPTIRELCRDAGIASLNGVVDHLKALHRKGWIRHTKPGTARSYTLSAATVELVPSGEVPSVVAENEKQELKDLLEKAEEERKKFKKLLDSNKTSISSMHPRLRELTEFLSEFPDNISKKLKECKTPMQGALLIINSVDDILCGDYEA
jgi:hypothetical protein